MASKNSCYYPVWAETEVYKASRLHHNPYDDWRIYNTLAVLTKDKYLICGNGIFNGLLKEFK
jgi:hypothetical protein